MLTKSDSLGEIAVGKVVTRLSEKGIVCSFPRIPSRYDIITDTHGKLERCQIKYCSRESDNGAVNLKLVKHGRTYKSHEIDILYVYIPQIDSIIKLLPKQFDSKRELVIRFRKSDRYSTTQALRAEDFIF